VGLDGGSREGLAPRRANTPSVDHPFESVPTNLPQGFWRTAAVVAILVATVELVLLIVTGTALMFGGGSSAPAAHETAAKAKTAAPPKPAPHHHAVAEAKLARKQVTVMVLNGNGRPGAAAGAAALVRRHGYTIRTVGNASRMSYAHSMVMYRPGYEGEGRRLARDLKIRRVGPLDGMRPSQLHGAKAVLIIGA